MAENHPPRLSALSAAILHPKLLAGGRTCRRLLGDWTARRAPLGKYAGEAKQEETVFRDFCQNPRQGC